MMHVERILLSVTISSEDTLTIGATTSNTNKNMKLEKCSPFTDCMSEINNTQVDNVNNIDLIMSMYNLIQYSDNCSKTSGSLWKYYRDKPSLNHNDNIVDFSGGNHNCKSFKYTQKNTNQTDNDEQNKKTKKLNDDSIEIFK